MKYNLVLSNTNLENVNLSYYDKVETGKILKSAHNLYKIYVQTVSPR